MSCERKHAMEMSCGRIKPEMSHKMNTQFSQFRSQLQAVRCSYLDSRPNSALDSPQFVTHYEASKCSHTTGWTEAFCVSQQAEFRAWLCDDCFGGLDGLDMCQTGPRTRLHSF